MVPDSFNTSVETAKARAISDIGVCTNWLFNVKKFCIYEQKRRGQFPLTTTDYRYAVYEAQYGVDDMPSYNGNLPFTSLKKEYASSYDKREPQFESLNYKNPILVNSIFSPHRYTRIESKKTSGQEAFPETSDGKILGEYYYHKDNWIASFLDGLYTFEGDQYNELVFKEIKKRQRFSREKNFNIIRRITVLEYFYPDETESEEEKKKYDLEHCDVCGDCDFITEFLGVSSVTVKYLVKIYKGYDPVIYDDTKILGLSDECSFYRSSSFGDTVSVSVFLSKMSDDPDSGCGISFVLAESLIGSGGGFVVVESNKVETDGSLPISGSGSVSIGSGGFSASYEFTIS